AAPVWILCFGCLSKLTHKHQLGGSFVFVSTSLLVFEQSDGQEETTRRRSYAVCVSLQHCLLILLGLTIHQTGIISLYDCVFKKNPGYNQKLHRDDREHANSLGLHVNEEEQERPVGVLMSSVYGRHINQPVEPLNRDHVRVNHVKADFYRKNDIPSFRDPGFGHISPA
ncbi:PREDICTED: uncharacterized protein C5orf49 homolog, partial [Miniopterus natalensis]|uniref:uncharacterized protein C5orf49 homolog n=1 Tax=Miniopterus natalensis TaxID=291302 RepID=UPI0007A71405